MPIPCINILILNTNIMKYNKFSPLRTIPAQALYTSKFYEKTSKNPFFPKMH